jgi:hypothetical protein
MIAFGATNLYLVENKIYQIGKLSRFKSHFCKKILN